MGKAGVAPSPGTATRTYYRALAEGDVAHYGHEAPLLQPLADRPTDAYVRDDLQAVQSAIRKGQDRTPPDLLPYWRIVAGASAGVLALALIAGLAWLLTARGPATVRPAEEEADPA
jgi:hypothetical protein